MSNDAWFADAFDAASRHHGAGRAAEAEAAYRDILRRNPDHLGALGEFGRLALQLGQARTAAALLARAVALRPEDAILRNNLAAAYEHAGHPAEAVACHRANIARHPAFAPGLNNLGNALKSLDRLDLAIAAYRRAVAAAPDDWLALNNLGSSLHQANRDAEAVAAYRTALALRDDPEAHHGLALALLAQGDFARGWPEYEWRARTEQHAPSWPRFARPRWQGEAAAGRVLLIHAEQGLGDMLQFCRYVPLVAARGMKVVLWMPDPLVRLFRRLDGVAEVVGLRDPLPAFDLHCPMMSLPLIFGTRLETIPAAVPYLSPWPQDIVPLGAGSSPKVGLAWAGNPYLQADRRRSLAVDDLRPLLGRADLALYSLQKDKSAPPGVIDPMGRVRDFADTAALIANLDLVISVDTAVAHLAGAMGKPVWLLNRFDAEWRWLRDRDDSPWYPTLRQFRQASPGDWAGVIARVDAELRRMGAPSSSHWPKGAGCTI
jgi:Flp pilus assembly protein TadD